MSIYASAVVTETPDSARITYLSQSVSAETHRRYELKYNAFTKFIRTMKLLGKPNYVHLSNVFGDINIFAHFLSHLAAINNSRCRSTADGYRCAILHMQRILLLPTWAGSRDCISIVDGFAYQGKIKDISDTFRPARAQVTIPMHQEMISYCKQFFPAFTNAIELGFRVALRPMELMTLRKGSYDHKTAEVTIPDKRANAKNGLPLFVRKGVFDLKAQRILIQLESLTSSKGVLYFPFSILQLRKMFLGMVRALNFTELEEELGICLDGPHCLRHGGLAYLVDQGYTEKQLLVTKSTLQHYIKPNHKRARI